MLLIYSIVDYHLFFDGAVDIQILALLTRIRCKVSDTQVTGEANGPLVVIKSNDLAVLRMQRKVFFLVLKKLKLKNKKNEKFSQPPPLTTRPPPLEFMY